MKNVTKTAEGGREEQKVSGERTTFALLLLHRPSRPQHS